MRDWQRGEAEVEDEDSLANEYQPEGEDEEEV